MVIVARLTELYLYTKFNISSYYATHSGFILKGIFRFLLLCDWALLLVMPLKAQMSFLSERNSNH